jgi:hypothetical protein
MGAGTAIGSEKKALLYKSAIVITIISIGLTIYYISIKKCSTCRLR